MESLATNKAKGPPKKDFRAFLKQKKAVGANLKNDDDIIVAVKEKTN